MTSETCRVCGALAVRLGRVELRAFGRNVTRVQATWEGSRRASSGTRCLSCGLVHLRFDGGNELVMLVADFDSWCAAVDVPQLQTVDLGEALSARAIRRYDSHQGLGVKGGRRPSRSGP